MAYELVRVNFGSLIIDSLQNYKSCGLWTLSIIMDFPAHNKWNFKMADTVPHLNCGPFWISVPIICAQNI